MAVRMRLTRFGAKKNAFYRIVVADGHSPRDGRILEVVGQYNPHKGLEKAVLRRERITYWLGKGVQPSGVVRQILKRQGKEAAR